MNNRHIVIIRLSAIGDVAMAATVARQAATQFPNIKFTMISRPFLRPLFDGLPNLQFVAADEAGKHRGIRGLWRLFRAVQALQPSSVADIHNALRTQILRLFFTISGRRVYSIKKGKSEKRRLTRRNNKILKQLETSFDRYRRTIEKCIGQPLNTDVSYSLPDFSNKVEMYAKYAIGIAPFAFYEGKIYPTDKMEQIVAHFAHRSDVQIFLFGGSNERNLLEQWEFRYPHTQSIAGKLDLSSELALMQKLSVMISMDSANMHLASFVGTPVVSVWGSTHPYAGFYGWKQQPHNAASLDLPCRPCSTYGNKKCIYGDYHCLRDIAPATIIEKTEAFLCRK